MSAAPRFRMSYAEYLAAEQASEVKHEYLRGEVFAMAGGTLEHSRLAVNLQGELRSALAGRRCHVFNSDARLRIVETDRSTYPDAMVVCGQVQRAGDDHDAVTNPVVIVEVLSDSTEAEDRGDKFAHYRRIPSLREYVLVSQKAPRIEIFRREGDHWTFTEAGRGEIARFASLEVDVSVDAVYGDPLS
jgi:Uma2 family endonuclease